MLHQAFAGSAHQTMSNLSAKPKLLLLVMLGFVGLFIYRVLDTQGLLAAMQDGQRILSYLQSLGLFGPVMIIIMMTVAIMVSPLPSAPIAIAAGAAYGHGWGTLYVLLGSLCGAIGAFMIGRYLGYEAVRNYAERRLPKRLYDSQNTLMGFVLLTRLMPFLSFDIISYAAGLTPLTLWRFILATGIGIAPASFLLAHIGSEFATTELNRIAMALLLLVVVSVVLMLVRLRWGSDSKQS